LHIGGFPDYLVTAKEAYKKGDQVAKKRGRVKVQDEGKFVEVCLFVCTYLGATCQQWR
jgi:hypothetical protein